MPKTFKGMKPHRPAQIVYLTLVICLIGLAGLLSGCASVPAFPTKRIWEVDIKSGVCAEWAIVNAETLQVQHIKDWPLSKCNGVFGFATADTPKVLDWSSDMIKLGKSRCQ